MIEQPAARIGIIGGGFGALIAYSVLRFRGVPASDIHVFSTDLAPGDEWLRYVRSIRQQTLRSESAGHFYPTDSPGLATVEAWRTRSFRPLWRSWFDQYRPTVSFIVHHAREVAERTGFWQSLIQCRISRVTRESDAFVLWDNQGQRCGTVQHLIIAVGHGSLNVPACVRSWQEQNPDDARVCHAFGEKQYSPHAAYMVLGDGITAATEWVNILEAGGVVVALTRSKFVFGQPLNAPRKFFSKRGLAPYYQQATEQRRATLAQATRGTIPLHPEWRILFRQAQQEGRLQLMTGEVVGITANAESLLTVQVQAPEGGHQDVYVDRVISATGFRSAATHPLWQTLVQDFAVPLDPVNGLLQVADDLTVPGLSQTDSYAFALGPAAAWVLPGADSFGGMKIAARRVAARIIGPEHLSLRQAWQNTRAWWQLLVTPARLL